MTNDALVAAARGVFEATGAERVDPAYILPSDIPLELSGEAVCAYSPIIAGMRWSCGRT